MREYNSPKELLDYIRSKGVIIHSKEDALNKIQTYSYYSIITTYKFVFKDIDGEYKKNVSFDEIYTLFEFDKNLRSIFLHFSLEIEMILKTLLAETLSSRYGIQNYLVVKNFDETLDKSIIAETICIIEEEIDKQNRKHGIVTDCIEKYGFIPPFFLTKILTLGKLSRLYAMLKQSDRQNISKKFKLSDKVLKQIIVNITIVRNICAHNDRLFSFRSKFRISVKYIQKNYDEQFTNIYIIMKCMKILLPIDKRNKFTRLVYNEIKILDSRLNSITVDNILNIMGFNRYK